MAAGAGAPEGPGDGIDDTIEGVESGELGAHGGDEGVADGLNFFHDGAGEGEGWERGVGGGRGLNAVEDDAHEPGEILALATEDFGGNDVTLVGAAENDFGEAGEVGCGASVGVLDEVIERGKLPELHDGVEESGGELFIAGEECGAEAFATDLVAGALVGELGSPAAGGDERAVGHATGDVGAGAGHDEHAGAALKGCVQRDFYIAEEDEVAGDAGGEGFAEPVGDQRYGFTGGADAGAGDGLW